MKKSNFLWLIVLLHLAGSSAAQSFRFVRDIPIAARDVLTDNLGNTYIITTTNTLVKFDAQGLQKSLYRANNAGGIGTVDVQNPLKILVFYPSFQRVVVLDNMLAEITEYPLSSFFPARIKLIATATATDGFWCYDENQYRLLKINNNFDNIVQAGNSVINTTLFIPQPIQMVEHNRLIYLNDTNKGILVADMYGNYLKTLPFTGVNSFSIFNQELWYVQNDSLQAYHLVTLATKAISLPTAAKSAAVRIFDKQLYIITEKAVSLWAF